VTNLAQEKNCHPERRRAFFARRSRRTCGCFCYCISGCNPRRGPALISPTAGCPIHAVSSHAGVPSERSLLVGVDEWAIARKRDPLRLRARLQPCRKLPSGKGASASEVCSPVPAKPIRGIKKQDRHKTQSNFQSTSRLLTPTIKWNQTQTVRRKPDCTI
jgi:hypothetical protein